MVSSGRAGDVGRRDDNRIECLKQETCRPAGGSGAACGVRAEWRRPPPAHARSHPRAGPCQGGTASGVVRRGAVIGGFRHVGCVRRGRLIGSMNKRRTAVATATSEKWQGRGGRLKGKV